MAILMNVWNTISKIVGGVKGILHEKVQNWINGRFVAIRYDSGNPNEGIAIFDCKELQGSDIFIETVIVNSDYNIYEYKRWFAGSKYSYRTLYIDPFGLSKLMVKYKRSSEYIDKCIQKIIGLDPSGETFEKGISLIEASKNAEKIGVVNE